MPHDPDIDDILGAVQTMHSCEAVHLQSAYVVEKQDEKVVWQGQIETFRLTGHATADRAFAWSWDDSEQTRYIAILNLAPIGTPREALRSAIASGRQLEAPHVVGDGREKHTPDQKTANET